MGATSDGKVQGAVGDGVKKGCLGEARRRLRAEKVHVGEVYGSLEVVGVEHKAVSGPYRGKYVALVKCTVGCCGAERLVPVFRLYKGVVVTCGQHKKKSPLPRGYRSGFLTVIDETTLMRGSFLHRRVICTAPGCSFEGWRQVSLLRAKKIKSCGCQHPSKTRKSLIGTSFGKLTVIAELSSGRWTCVCSCDRRERRNVRGSALLSGKTTQCRTCDEEETWELNGVLLTLDELVTLSRVPRVRLRQRLRKGWSVEKALSPIGAYQSSARMRHERIKRTTGTYRDIAAKLGVSVSLVEKVKTGKRG
jgi:hypothetical protein